MVLYLFKCPHNKTLLSVAKKFPWVNPDVLSYLAVIVAFAMMFCYVSVVTTLGCLLVSAVLTLLCIFNTYTIQIEKYRHRNLKNN